MSQNNNNHNGYSYSEQLTLIPQPSNKKNHLKVSVKIEATSTLSSSSSSSPSHFPLSVIDIIRRYNVERILIQHKSQSSSSSSSTTTSSSSSSNEPKMTNSNIFPMSRDTGPMGASVFVRLRRRNKHNQHNNATIDSDDEYDDSSYDVSSTLHNQFHQLLRSLSGRRLLCTPTPDGSDDFTNISPHVHSYRDTTTNVNHPNDDDDNNDNARSVDFHFNIPEERICHEWFQEFKMQLLPCRDKRGLFSNVVVGGTTDDVTLYQSGAVLDRSLWIDIIVDNKENDNDNDNDNDEQLISLHQGVSYTVHVPQRQRRQGEEIMGFSLRDVLLQSSSSSSSSSSSHEESLRSCPLSHATMIHTRVLKSSHDDTTRTIDVNFTHFHSSIVNDDDDDNSQYTAIYTHDLSSLPQPLSLTQQWLSLTTPSPQQQQQTIPQLFSIQRILNRHSGTSNSGTLSTIISNNDVIHPVTMTLLDVYPTDLIKPQYHSFRIHLLKQRRQRHGDRRELSFDDLEERQLTLSSSSTTFHLVITLPPQSTLHTSMTYHPLYLPWENFPHDLNRGVLTYPSIVTLHPLLRNATTPPPPPPTTRLYSPNVIILPPVPDTTMPFNVISLTCTLVTFLFGSLVNRLVRRTTERMGKDFRGEGVEESLLKKVMKKFRRLGEKLRIKRSGGGDAGGGEVIVTCGDDKKEHMD